MCVCVCVCVCVNVIYKDLGATYVISLFIIIIC